MKPNPRILTHEPGHGLAIIPEGNLRRADGRVDYDYVKRIYDAMLPEILIAGGRWIDPYFVDWLQVFTPIEYSMWSLIRSQPTPFYPQVPVGRFFVDFGNPCLKLAIECDGKRWHNAERDAKRDEELAAMGWAAVHFSGRTCFDLPQIPDLKRIRECVTTEHTADWLWWLLDAESRAEELWITEEEVD